MKEKSLKSSALLNMIRTLLNVFFPLITFPYITRILSPDGIGILDFGKSISGYFVLISGLGITQYAVREGSAIRSDRERFTDFASQIFSINFISMFVSYMLLFITISLSSYLREYQSIILIFSLQMIFNTLSVEWIYNIYEDFAYITIRSIIVQIISIILMFLLVKQPSDFTNYAWITTLSTGGGYILNFIHVKKYVNLKFTIDKMISTHLKPIFILFFNNIASTIYLNSDITVIGFISGNYYVGIYSTAVKIYTIVKQLTNALLMATVPRLSNYYMNKEVDKYKETLSRILEILSMLVFPATVGLIMLREPIILIIAGEEFVRSTSSLMILSVGLIFSVLATFLVYGILLIQKKEKYILKITVISALLNLVLNFAMVPFLQERGAAVSTMLSELLICILALRKIGNTFSFIINKKTILVIVIECISIICICFLTNIFVTDSIAIIISSIVVSITIYYLLLKVFNLVPKL